MCDEVRDSFSVMSYSTSNDIWNSTLSMNEENIFYGVCSVMQKLFVIGGQIIFVIVGFMIHIVWFLTKKVTIGQL